MISEQEKESIREEAKAILGKFAKSLENVKLKEKKDKKEVGGFREEKETHEGNGDFRARMFKNAPNKDDNHIIAEKKKW